VKHPRLEVQQDSAWNVTSVVGLVKEDVFAITALGRKVLEVAVFVDAVFLAELLPELLPDTVAALASLECYDFSIRYLYQYWCSQLCFSLYSRRT